MKTTLSPPPPISGTHLMRPNAATAGLIYLAIVRDTRGRALPAEQRFNHFPVSPLCSVTWVFSGATLVVPQPNSSEAENPVLILPNCFFSGPSTRPLTSWNPGPVSALTIGFYPDAWQSLTGIAPDQYIDRMVPLDGAIVGPLQAVFQGIFNAGSYQQRFSQLETDLMPPWQSCRHTHTPAYLWVQDWVTGIAARTTSSGVGKSMRQIQRRVKNWTGQSQLDLNRLARVESLFAQTLATKNSGPAALSSLAIDGGFSDQSHMGREVKRVTGASPKQINHLIATDENYWFYRLL